MDRKQGDPESRSKRREFSRGQLLKSAAAGGGALSLAPLLAACSSSSSSKSGGANGSFPSHPKWKFVFVNHVTTNSFFVPTQYALQDACALVGCTYQWTGSQTSDVGQMVTDMNNAISAKADGIGVSIIDPRAFNDPVSRALAAGIPVIAYNADAPASSKNKRLAYIGQDLYLSGFQMGQRIVSLVKSGDIAIAIATPGSLNIQPRMDGAIAAIKASGAPITVHQINSGALINDELSRIDAYYLGHKNTKGLFAVDAGSTQSCGQVIKKYNLAAKGVKGGGYDLLPTTLDLIKSGHLDFTIDQQPYQQGFWPVMQLFLWKLSGGLEAPSSMNTGLKFLTKSNISPYLTTKTRYEGSSKAEKVVK